MAPERTILDGATVVTMDGVRTEHATGHVVIENGRIAAVGAGRAPEELDGPRTDVAGCLVTVDEHELTRSAVLAHRTLLARASTVTCKEGTAS